ncbi:MAG: aldehyde dehydrogenase family protein, partial [Paracoccaceae bacterium]
MNVQDMDAHVTTGLFINGESRAASGGETYDIFNPARPDELVGHAASATANDVDEAVRAAHAAFPNWAGKSYAERAALLNEIADVLVADEADVNYRSRLFCREHGKIIKETLMERTRLGDRFRLTAAYAARP